MDGALAGTVALVTGAGRGIGRAIAETFAARGASVVVADIAGDAAEAVAAAIGGAAVRADVCDERAVAEMVAFAVAQFGRLDCAVNNAAISPEPKPFVEHTLAEWQRVIDVNLTGVFLCMQHELRQFLAQGGGGAIVNISSAAAIAPAPGLPQYTAAKHGVLGLTKQAAQEFARHHIRVNAVLPGQTETEPMQAYLAGMPDGGQRMLSRLPMGRMATPAEIAQAAVWLCSADASYVSGASLVVDGAVLSR